MVKHLIPPNTAIRYYVITTDDNGAPMFPLSLVVEQKHLVAKPQLMVITILLHQ